MLEIGSLVDGKYRVLREVGHGGMSVVYMAINERANKTWAIKEVRRDGSQNYEVVRQGLLVETDMLKRLDHPHLPSIIDVIEGEDTFLIVMDYIEGQTLSKVLKEYGPQPQESVIDWGKQLCDVLGYLHSRKPPIIYRDMKPSNVMLKPDGNVVLFDFGTAREYKVTSQEDTTCLGTRGYAAPEQYGGHGQTDARTDIYCLGATLYHLLTGHDPSQPPFEMYPIRQWNPNLSVGLEYIIQKCTQLDPANRYQSCAELMYALEHPFLDDIRYRKQQKKKFIQFAVPASLALALGIGAGVFHGLEVSTTTDSYAVCIAAAKNSTVKDDEIENYRKAINLDPSNEEAYIDLLTEGLLDDDVLTSEESETLRSIMIEQGNGSDTNESVLQKNTEGYDNFAYQAGVAYYYYFEEKSNKKNAKSYFETAMASQYLTSSQIARAQRLYTICEYYNKIGVPDATGDASTTYGDYWNDLTALCEGNLVEQDNEKTALIMYKELATQIVNFATDFKKSGVTQEQMEAQLTNIETRLASDFGNVSSSNQESVQEEITELNSIIEKAKRTVESAFSGQTE